MKAISAKVIGSLLALASSSVFAADVTWTFNLPATAAQNPPYPTVATLSLTQVGSDVQFVLDPNESSPGVLPDPTDNFVKSIDFVYKGHALTSGEFVFNSGAAVDSFAYVTNPNNVDAGYKSNDEHIQIGFINSAPKHGDPDDRFSFDETSTWTIKNVLLTDFTGTVATANNKPTPVFGVISVAPYTLTDVHPTPSNWVALAAGPGGHGVVPEPETYGMLMAGLGLVGFMVRRKKSAV